MVAPIMNRFLLGSLAGVFLLLTILWKPGYAQELKFNELGVDIVKTPKFEFRGFVLQDGQTITLAVDRSWVLAKYPQQQETLRALERRRLRPILKQYDERLEEWQQQTRDAALKRTLEQEKKRIVEQHQVPEIDEREFMVLEFKVGEVAQKRLQPNKRKQVAGAAYQNNLDNVAGRSVSSLVRELNQIKKGWKSEPIDLGYKLTATAHSEREWQVKQAMVEFDVTGSLEFQGEGEMLFEKSSQPNLNQILKSMVSNVRGNSISQIGRELGIPEFQTPSPQADPNRWLEKVTRQADKSDVRSVVVKRIVPGKDSDLVTVEAVFLARVSGKWETIVKRQATARLSEQNRSTMNELRNDPQVESVLKMIEQFGLGGQADSMLETALRKGAAAKSATEELKQSFDPILNRNAFQLEGPLVLD